MANADQSFRDMVEGKSSGPPASRLLGWRCLQIDPENGTIAVEFQPRGEFLNPARTIQGGFVAAMLDDTMSPAVYAMLEPGEFNTTLEFKVSFVRPAKLGRLVAKARVVHRGRSIAFAESELRDAEGQLLATATATMKIVRAQTGFGAQ
jgi:uncharacterized protein (TIGR00369 family)